jgi:hypothetical protein
MQRASALWHTPGAATGNQSALTTGAIPPFYLTPTGAPLPRGALISEPSAAALPCPAPCPRHPGGGFLLPPPCPVKPAPAARPLSPLNLPPAPTARAPCTVPRGRCPAIPAAAPPSRPLPRHPGPWAVDPARCPALRAPWAVGRGPWAPPSRPRAVHRVQRAVGWARVADPGICHPRFVITKKRAPGRAIRAAGSCTSAPRIRAATRHPRRAIRAARMTGRNAPGAPSGPRAALLGAPGAIEANRTASH